MLRVINLFMYRMYLCKACISIVVSLAQLQLALHYVRVTHWHLFAYLLCIKHCSECHTMRRIALTSQFYLLQLFCQLCYITASPHPSCRQCQAVSQSSTRTLAMDWMSARRGQCTCERTGLT